MPTHGKTKKPIITYTCDAATDSHWLARPFFSARLAVPHVFDTSGCTGFHDMMTCHTRRPMASSTRPESNGQRQGPKLSTNKVDWTFEMSGGNAFCWSMQRFVPRVPSLSTRWTPLPAQSVIIEHVQMIGVVIGYSPWLCRTAQACASLSVPCCGSIASHLGPGISHALRFAV